MQQYALFPHLRVADNVAFGLRARRWPGERVRARVAEVLDLVGMAGYAHRLPRELSGGQQQRVAIARALAIRPPALLLDEPLSALDAALRAELLAELQRLRTELPDVAILYVTHDQTEALALAQRIGIMRDGRLVDVGTADRVYRLPATRVHVATPGTDRASVAPGTPAGTGLICVAAVTPHKGYDLLAEALSRATEAPRPVDWERVRAAEEAHAVGVEHDGCAADRATPPPRAASGGVAASPSLAAPVRKFFGQTRRPR